MTLSTILSFHLALADGRPCVSSLTTVGRTPYFPYDKSSLRGRRRLSIPRQKICLWVWGPFLLTGSHASGMRRSAQLRKSTCCGTRRQVFWGRIGEASIYRAISVFRQTPAASWGVSSAGDTVVIKTKKEKERLIYASEAHSRARRGRCTLPSPETSEPWATGQTPPRRSLWEISAPVTRITNDRNPLPHQRQEEDDPRDR